MQPLLNLIGNFFRRIITSGRHAGRHAAIKYILGSTMVHIIRETETHVPSVIASVWMKSLKRRIEVMRPLYYELELDILLIPIRGQEEGLHAAG